MNGMACGEVIQAEASIHMPPVIRVCLEVGSQIDTLLHAQRLNLAEQIAWVSGSLKMIYHPVIAILMGGKD